MLWPAPLWRRWQGTLQRFADYPATESHKGKVARPKFRTRAEYEYRTRLRDVVSRDDQPNFAGRYYVATWGCGSACVSSGIVDARTGLVTLVPFTISGWREVDDTFEAVTFRPASRLIVFSGERNEKGDMARHFYVMEKGRLKPLRSVPQPDANFMTPLE